MRGLVIAEANRDGKLDLVNTNSNDTVSLRLGDGAGGFGANTDFGTDFSPFSLVIGDLNRDGKSDLAHIAVKSLSFGSVFLNTSAFPTQ